MSWSRFGADGSDIYTFPTTRDGVHGGECCACPLNEIPEGSDAVFPASFFTASLDEFTQHLAAHVEARHCVPADLVAEVRAEWAEYGGAA